jgi:Cadherin cytoplasmic region/EGF-like domain
MAKNIERYCASNNPCTNAFCPEPFECVDLWNKYECRYGWEKFVFHLQSSNLHFHNCFTYEHSCGDGMVVSAEGKGCVDRNECLDMPCLNGGTCINQEPRLRYRCVCPENFWGENCMFMKERQALKLSTSALAAVIACLLIIISKSQQYPSDYPPNFIFLSCPVLLFLYFSFNRKRTTNVKKPVTKDDIRENIINYCDEGGGENDVMAFDMKTLKIPIGSQLPELVQHKGTSRNKNIFIEV